MAAARTAPRSRQREEEHPDDVFVARTLEFSEWARSNTQTLVVFGIVLALIVGGILYYANYRADLAEQAGLELERIHQTLAVGEIEAARAELITFLDRFGGTPHAGEAGLLLGQLYLESDQVPQAILTLGAAAEDLRDPLGIQAAQLLAKAREEQGELERAEELYLRIADQAVLDFQIQNALEDAARLRADRGDFTGAAALYERILEGMEEGHPERGLYEMRLQEIRTRASR